MKSHRDPYARKHVAAALRDYRRRRRSGASRDSANRVAAARARQESGILSLSRWRMLLAAHAKGAL